MGCQNVVDAVGLDLAGVKESRCPTMCRTTSYNEELFLIYSIVVDLCNKFFILGSFSLERSSFKKFRDVKSIRTNDSFLK